MGTLQRGDATDLCGDSSTKRNKVIEVGNFSLWSELPAVLLELILKRVGVIDYFMFACVCKSWRSVAIAFRQEFMASQAPLVVLMASSDRKCCYFYDIFDKRLYRTALPHLVGNKCLGFSSGYLVFNHFIRRSIWLMNPFTRHVLEFPEPPYYFSNVILASLAKSDSSFVVVAFSGPSPYKVQFCRSGDSNWTTVLHGDSNWTTVLQSYYDRILDVAVFKGKIYVLSSNGQIWTLNLNPPGVTSLHVKSDSSFSKNLHLVVSNEKLYVVDFRPIGGLTKFYKLDFERMEWVNVNLKDEVLFLGDRNCRGLSFLPPSWEHFDKQLNRVLYLGGRYYLSVRLYDAGWTLIKSVPAIPEGWKTYNLLFQPLWYFPHLSSNVDFVYDD